MNKWWAVCGAVLLALATLPACTTPRHAGPRPAAQRFSTEDYLPGVQADTFLPAHRQRAPVVVLIPGGSWRTADRTGLRPLAASLAGHGMVAVAARYRAADDGARFPVPVADVVCAVSYAVARARRAGLAPGPVVVLGHSAGAHLAALAALAPARFRARCPYPAVSADGFIGLAGPYDIMALQEVIRPLFGAGAVDDPSAWRAGNPSTWVRSRPGLRVLLAHGTTDHDVPFTMTTSFGDELRAAGHRVTVQLVPSADHAAIYRVDVIAGPVIRWIAGLSGQ
jgi:acetyl esterase/lipase